jgi:TRAP-type C4-dicarboxylate transport system permease large subunit
MIPLISIYVGGVLTLLMAFFHTRFYRMFNWQTEFEKISKVNSKIIYTVHQALLFLFILIGLISLIHAKELSRSFGLAAGFNLFLSLFWLWRLVWQLVYFKREKGKKQPPLVVFLISAFAILFVSYLTPIIYRIL